MDNVSLYKGRSDQEQSRPSAKVGDRLSLNKHIDGEGGVASWVGIEGPNGELDTAWRTPSREIWRLGGLHVGDGKNKWNEFVHTVKYPRDTRYISDLAEWDLVDLRTGLSLNGECQTFGYLVYMKQLEYWSTGLLDERRKLGMNGSLRWRFGTAGKGL